MREKKVPQWVPYVAAGVALGYAIYNYFKSSKKTPEELKEEGTSCYVLKNYEEALAKYNEALALIPAKEAHPELICKLYNNISQVYYAVENYKNSQEYAELVLAINPKHLNSFHRLMKIEEKNEGYGGLKGISIFAAYIIIKKYQAVEEVETNQITEEQQTIRKKEIQDVHYKMDAKIEALAKDMCASIPKESGLRLSFVKLEEILLVFKDALRDSSFEEATKEDEEILKCIDNRNYSLLVDSLEALKKEKKLTKRGNFLIGNIKFAQEKPQEAVEYLSKSQTVYGDVLSIYIQKLHNLSSEVPESQLSGLIKKKDDPLVRMYLAQVYLATNNMGQYLAKIMELENEKRISLPFIANSKSQFMLGEQKEAISTIKRALETFPEDINVLCTGIEILSQIELSSSSLAFLNELLLSLGRKKFSSSPRAAFFQYIGYTAKKDKENQDKYLDKAIELDLYNGSLLMQKAHTLISKGDQSGFSLFKKSAELSHDNSEEILKIMLTYQSVFALQEHFPDVSSITSQVDLQLS
ncbi:hypothetical protein NEFER02_1762 [Nematocida sp. LUAm2]|nr:hypothetical protein NEFER02_1762 [Nematocida sp. LUAm2]